MKRKSKEVLSGWIRNHKNGLIILTESREIGESDLLAQYIKENGSHVEVAILSKIKKEDYHRILLGGEPNGKYTTWFRQILSKQYQPFLFLPRIEAELLLFALNDFNFKNWYFQNSGKKWLRDIDLKDIERGLVLYSSSSINNQSTKIDEYWLKKVMEILLATKSIRRITFWGLPSIEFIKKMIASSVEDVVIYKHDSTWKMNIIHPKIIKSPNLYSSIEQSDLLIIGENKREFLSISFPKLIQRMRQKIIVDPFFLFEQKEMEAFHWNYIHKGIKYLQNGDNGLQISEECCYEID